MHWFADRYFEELHETVSYLRGNGRGWILGAIAFGWFLSMGVRLTYPVVLPHIRTSLELGLSTAGLLLTVLWTAYALGQFPGGFLADRWGPGTILFASTSLSAVTVLLVSLSPTAGLLFATTALLGLSTALYGPARFPLLSGVFPERSGTAIGVTQATGNLGNTLLPFIVGVVAGTVAWQFGVLLFVPLFVIIATAIWWSVPRRVGSDGGGGQNKTDSPAQSLSLDSIRYVISGLTVRSVLTIALIQMLGSFTYQGFTGFFPTYLIEIKSLSTGSASLLFGVFFAGGIVIQPITGMAGDKFGERYTLLGVLVFITASLAALPVIEGFWPLLAMTIALSSLLGRAVLALTYLTESLPADIRGTGLGILRTGYILLGSTSPLVIGVLGDAGYFDHAFWMLAGASFLMMLLCIILPPLSEVDPSM
ncbi:major facilitator superfamily protein [Natronococcus amylolyticus DSM 10524]|uniref:Major facilitator superfamily protein n=1 Tax=Natronococcus amylolyticus DSM 10524 TaxID=1227497 RepID=L9X2U7_9EURY|nr:MFS transporter [Natronococcus amylolyticus]ELY56020.1 major facilitator superfamily protein [Natronococcus amylolyticus DSM 10524]